MAIQYSRTGNKQYEQRSIDSMRHSVVKMKDTESTSKYRNGEGASHWHIALYKEKLPQIT